MQVLDWQAFARLWACCFCGDVIMLRLHLIRHSKPIIAARTCYGRLDVSAQDIDQTYARVISVLPPNLPLWTSPLFRCRELAARLHPQHITTTVWPRCILGIGKDGAGDDIPRAELDAWGARCGWLCSARRRIAAPTATAGARFRRVGGCARGGDRDPCRGDPNLAGALARSGARKVDRIELRLRFLHAGRCPPGKMPGMETFNPLRDAVPLGEIKRALVNQAAPPWRCAGQFAGLLGAQGACAAGRDRCAGLCRYGRDGDAASGHAQVHTIDRKWKQLGAVGQLKAELALYNTLKARGYDLIIHLTEHWRGAWLCRLLKPRWAVGPRCGGGASAGSRVLPIPDHA